VPRFGEDGFQIVARFRRRVKLAALVERGLESCTLLLLTKGYPGEKISLSMLAFLVNIFCVSAKLISVSETVDANFNGRCHHHW